MATNATSPAPVVVIGSGPAGAAAAVFLAKAGVSALLLEAGSEAAALGFTVRVRGITVAKRAPALQERQDFTPAGQPAPQLYEALAPGGLSNYWSCAVPRFSQEDFLDGKRAGEEQTWPIDYNDVAPWYDQVEPLLRIAGDEKDAARLPAARAHDRWKLAREWDAVASAAASTGREVVAMPYANGRTSIVTRSATAFNAYAQLIRPGLRSGLFAVRYDAKVLRLEWSARERRVVAVVYRDLRSGREERLACRAVIVAAGAVNSAQILLQSASADFPHGLGNEHDVLGRYFHDHPLGKVEIDLPKPVNIFPASYITRPSLERSPPLYAAAFMQWCGTPRLARTALEGRPGRSTELGFTVFGTMAPTRDDFVALEPKPAHNGTPHSSVVVALKYAPQVHETLERARDELIDILTRAGWQPRLRSWKVEVPGDSVHYAGGCRMHASPRFGVVDRVSRVHGVANVAVADSSVFTTGPEKNPVLTAMALAARAAHHLAQDLRSGDL